VIKIGKQIHHPDPMPIFPKSGVRASIALKLPITIGHSQPLMGPKYDKINVITDNYRSTGEKSRISTTLLHGGTDNNRPFQVYTGVRAA